MTLEVSPSESPVIREARPGDEAAIHTAHMRSIREVCVKDHGKDEIRGWGYRPLGDHWTQAIRDGFIWVVELQNDVQGFGYIRILGKESQIRAYLHALYLTPEVIGQGIGLKLASLMLGKAREMGAVAVDLDSSITAHGFYKKLGFKDSGARKQVEIGGYPVTCFPMTIIM